MPPIGMMDCWIIAQPSTPLPASEGSGDSETDLELVDDHGLACMQERAADDDDDDDDAESCSCESFGRAQIEDGSDDGGESDGDESDGAHGVDHEKGVLVWLQANAREKKEDEEVKVVDSGDDDRLFWETCLATGY